MSSVSLWRWGALPAEHRANFIHLYLDIAWFGVLNGSAIAFAAIYAARLGANSWQIGLLTAGPAVISLMFTLPAGQWLQQHRLNKGVFWTSVAYRFFYLPWILLPWLFNPQGQVWSLIVITLVMSIPGTALAVGFNALFAGAVPPEWRGHVTGVRNALLSITFVLTSTGCGLLLERLPFPLGYQMVFAIGFVGAAASSVHLWFVRPDGDVAVRPRTWRGLGDLARPGLSLSNAQTMRTTVGLRYLVQRVRPLLNLRVFRQPFGKILGLLFAFHLGQFLAIPIFPLFWVNNLGLTDAQIGLGNSVFYLLVFFGSTRLGWLTERFGHHRLMVIGIVIMSAYPLLTALTTNLEMFLFTAAVGGVAWSVVGGAISNYILERIPPDDRPANLAWYNLVLNAAVLLGSLLGPILADGLGLIPVLLIAAVARLAAAAALARWG
ncbi:MAG: MFS transporter [Anaerolineae bacterium]|nr:MFS transporter [Anaerolineae bacterium]